MPAQYKRGFAFVLILAVLLIIGAAAALGLYFVTKNPSSKTTTPITTQDTAATKTPAPIPDETASWKVYTNNNLGFSFRYPDPSNEYRVKELKRYEEGLMPDIAGETQICKDSCYVVFVWDNPQKLDGRTFWEKNFETILKGMGSENPKKSDYAAGEVKYGDNDYLTISFTYDNDPSIYGISRGNYFYEIQLGDPEHRRTILSTFKFK